MKETHTIFGAGQVGLQLARMLAAADKNVRLVRRGEPGPAIDGVTWLRGDATDAEFAYQAANGADVVYHCANPSHYHRWDELLPPLAHGIRGAATRAGARLVVLDNLYMYGVPEMAPFDERTPMQPCSRKGELRKRLAEELMAAHDRGEVEVAVGRASDFFGPHTPQAAVFHPRFFERLDKGRAVEVFGDPDQPHSYSYTPDVARGLFVLGTQSGTAGRVWHLPVSAQLSTRELVAQFAAAAGRDAKLRVLPDWLLSGLGLFVPLIGAVAEMTYQWQVPYLLDDGDFRRTFGVQATPLGEAVRTTLAANGLSPHAAAA